MACRLARKALAAFQQPVRKKGGVDWQTARSRDKQPLISQRLSLSFSLWEYCSPHCGFPVAAERKRERETYAEKKSAEGRGGTRQRRWQQASRISTHTHTHAYSSLYTHAITCCSLVGEEELLCRMASCVFRTKTFLRKTYTQPKDGTHAASVTVACKTRRGELIENMSQSEQGAYAAPWNQLPVHFGIGRFSLSLVFRLVTCRSGHEKSDFYLKPYH